MNMYLLVKHSSKE